MIKLMTAALALALFWPAMMFAQNNSQTDSAAQAQRQESSQANQTSVDGLNTAPHHMMRGTVSDNGKTFTSDNTAWHVSNPNALKNYNNQEVTVKFQFNTQNNSIKVDKVESGQ